MENNNQDNLNKDMPSCCQSKGKEGLKKGFIYALVPHTGCIAFMLFSILGATTFSAYLTPILKTNVFYSIIAISFMFAAISALLYLRKRSVLSVSGAKVHWKYLGTMLGTTIAINLLLVLVIFPYATNAANTGADFACSITDSSCSIDSIKNADAESLVTLKVDIPCSGHAFLIIQEVKKLEGVQSVVFRQPNLFDVSFNPGKITVSEILAAPIFKEFSATVSY